MRIKYKKLNFVRSTMLKHSSNIAKRVLNQELLQKINGLATECLEICVDLKIRFIMNTTVPKNVIKRAVNDRIKKDMETEMLNGKKTKDRLFDNDANISYLNNLGIIHCRLWFRYRARGIAGVKANAKGSYADLSCRFCDSESTENQEHLEVCDGFRFERRGLKMDSLLGRLKFWGRASTKLAAVAGGSPSGG